MEDEYVELPDNAMEVGRADGDGPMKDFGLEGQYDEVYEDDDGGNGFRGNRGRGNFRSEHTFNYMRLPTPVPTTIHRAYLH